MAVIRTGTFEPKKALVRKLFYEKILNILLIFSKNIVHNSSYDLLDDGTPTDYKYI